jgi:hypothetical protein
MAPGTGSGKIFAWLYIFAWPPALVGGIIDSGYDFETLAFGTALWVLFAILSIPPLFSSTPDVEEEGEV